MASQQWTSFLPFWQPQESLVSPHWQNIGELFPVGFMGLEIEGQVEQIKAVYIFLPIVIIINKES